MSYLLHKKINYMIHNNVNTNGLDGFEDMSAYFNVADIQVVIQFITTQLIVAMENETIDMDAKYGGSVNWTCNKKADNFLRPMLHF